MARKIMVWGAQKDELVEGIIYGGGWPDVAVATLDERRSERMVSAVPKLANEFRDLSRA